MTIKFAEIGGRVRKCMNPHDFGYYPSFEIDYPADINCENEFEQNDEEIDECGKWEDLAWKINKEYVNEFENYL